MMYEANYSMSISLSKELFHGHVGSEHVLELMTQLLQVRAFKNDDDVTPYDLTTQPIDHLIKFIFLSTLLLRLHPQATSLV
jgi:hypothetical protein